MQSPCRHAAPFAQMTQPFAPAPHSKSSVPGWQLPNASQQPEHVVGSHGRVVRPQDRPDSSSTKTVVRMGNGAVRKHVRVRAASVATVIDSRPPSE